ncbi:MAG TPA: prephenate dehydrogenase [Firmicutes bacterium]|nr:prephenate dehydrogenase [Bacillota bacterium]
MKIAVAGLGLIGGSICKSLKKNTRHTIFGLDTDKKTVELALMEEAIDLEIMPQQLYGAEVTFVCLYPEATIDFILENIPNWKKGAIVIDVCGIKSDIVQRVAAPLKEAGIRFVGAHPMAGREFSGFAYAQADLFKSASFIITPIRDTDPDAVRVAEQLASEMQFGKIVHASPEEHDRVIAFTSQLAHIVSNAYIKSPSAQLRYGFSAGSYQDLTRVARLNEDMWTSLFMRNRIPLIAEIDTIIQNLTEYRDALAKEDAQRLHDLLRDGREIKEQLN